MNQEHETHAHLDIETHRSRELAEVQPWAMSGPTTPIVPDEPPAREGAHFDWEMLATKGPIDTNRACLGSLVWMYLAETLLDAWPPCFWHNDGPPGAETREHAYFRQQAMAKSFARWWGLSELAAQQLLELPLPVRANINHYLVKVHSGLDQWAKDADAFWTQAEVAPALARAVVGFDKAAPGGDRSVVSVVSLVDGHHRVLATFPQPLWDELHGPGMRGHTFGKVLYDDHLNYPSDVPTDVEPKGHFARAATAAGMKNPSKEALQKYLTLQMWMEANGASQVEGEDRGKGPAIYKLSLWTNEHETSVIYTPEPLQHLILDENDDGTWCLNPIGV